MDERVSSDVVPGAAGSVDTGPRVTDGAGAGTPRADSPTKKRQRHSSRPHRTQKAVLLRRRVYLYSHDCVFTQGRAAFYLACEASRVCAGGLLEARGIRRLLPFGSSETTTRESAECPA